jgi:hypothetical protein
MKSAFLALVDDYRTEIWEPAGQAMDRADRELRAQFGSVEAAELFGKQRKVAPAKDGCRNGQREA